VNTVLLSFSPPALLTARVLLEALEHAQKIKAVGKANAGRVAGRLLRKCDGGGSDREFVESDIVLKRESTEFQERYRC
jgi:hypothetical protein